MSPDAPPSPSSPAPPRPVRSENLVVNLVCNVVVPTVILTWMSSDRWLGPRWGLIVALAFPLGYGIYDFAKRRRWNFISVIGFVSVLFSGGFGLMDLSGIWFAVKDAAIPAIIGLAVLASMGAKTPLVNELLYNPQVIDVEKVDAVLAARGARAAFAGLMRRSTGLLSLAFFLSAGLNFMLARHLLTGPPGTATFNAQLAKMHLLSWPVIVLPSTVVMFWVLWRLLAGIKTLTGLELEEIFRTPPDKSARIAAATDRQSDGK